MCMSLLRWACVSKKRRKEKQQNEIHSHSDSKSSWIFRIPVLLCHTSSDDHLNQKTKSTTQTDFLQIRSNSSTHNQIRPQNKSQIIGKMAVSIWKLRLAVPVTYNSLFVLTFVFVAAAKRKNRNERFETNRRRECCHTQILSIYGRWIDDSIFRNDFSILRIHGRRVGKSSRDGSDAQQHIQIT